MTDVEILSERDGLVGTTFRETVEEGRRGTQLTGEVTGYDPGSLVAFHLRGDYTVVDVSYRVSERDGGARLDVDADVRFRSVAWFSGLLFRPVFRRNVRRQIDDELRRLKRLCE